MEYAYITDTGKVRDHNEDSVLIVHNSDNDTLMAIADGMGGHSAGEVASSIAITHLAKDFNENVPFIVEQIALSNHDNKKTLRKFFSKTIVILGNQEIEEMKSRILPRIKKMKVYINISKLICIN